MKIVAVIAHPDDEAFGPGGTLAKLAKEGNDVYILCATRGESGASNIGGQQTNLGEIRYKELLSSAKILGIKKIYFLGFIDGALCNNLYHQLAKKIEDKLKIIKPEILITYEPRGISGHIDHITVSLVTTYVFYKLPFIKNLDYYCIDETQRNFIQDYFIYFPPGYKKSEITKVVDISPVWQTKIAAIRAHQSQGKDAKRIILMLKALSILRGFRKEEYFISIKK